MNAPRRDHIRQSTRPALAIFARKPEPGSAKTRLIPLLGAQGAATFQAALLRDSIRKLYSLSLRATPYVFVTGSPRRKNRGDIPANFSDFGTAGCSASVRLIEQRGSDLGERLARAFRFLLAKHPAAVVIGTDSPLLRIQTLRLALRELGICDAVLGPCPDGGYYLVGMRRGPHAPPVRVFSSIRWGTHFAFRDTLSNLLRRGLSCSILEQVPDVDRPRDLQNLCAEFTRSLTARRLAPSTWRFLERGMPLPSRLILDARRQLRYSSAPGAAGAISTAGANDPARSQARVR